MWSEGALAEASVGQSISLGEGGGGVAFLCLWPMPADVFAVVNRTERGCVVLVAEHVVGAAIERDVAAWVARHYHLDGPRAYVAA